MTPLEIEILLHYHVTGPGRDFRDGDAQAPAVKDAMDWFVAEGYLVETGGSAKYTRTAKLDAYVEALKEVPEPQLRWVIP